MKLVLKYRIKGLLSFVLMWLPILATTQDLRFSVGALAGLSISQIDGDYLQGYDHWGFMGGLHSIAHVSKRVSLSVELMYNQRGSKSNRFSYQSYLSSPQKVTTEYAEINALFHLMDWYHLQDAYYRLDFHGGLSFGRLIRTSVVDNIVRPENFNNIAAEFNSNDISLLLGVAYKINRHWGWGFRFSRSLGLLFDSEKSQIKSQVLRDWHAYHLGLYTFYNF